MIVIKNSQRKIAVNIERLRIDAHAMLQELGYDDFQLSIWISNNTTLKKYNGQFRNKPVPTDILSFPFHEIEPGKKIVCKDPSEKHLGDLLISAEYVFKRYPNEQFYPRLQVLLAHGICHLLGHDHDTPETDKKMIAMEQKLLKCMK